MSAIRAALYTILARDHPQTIRGAFYQATVAGVIPKTDENAGYPTVQRLLVEMRRSGEVPYEWIADSTRWMRKPRTWSSAEEALQNTASTYRRALWEGQEACVEVWVEKEALAGVLVEVTDPWDVPLMVTRGYPSLSFLHSAAVALAQRDQWTYIYYLGDRDPSGVDIDRAVVQGIGDSLDSIYKTKPECDPSLRTFDGHATFKRIAVTERQIERWSLPVRPTKKQDTRSKGFRGGSVELDAIPAHLLRGLVEIAIKHHIDEHKLEILKSVEDEERRVLLKLVEGMAA
jgi:hypothetical protein